jgi:hypothetical protein
MRSRPLYPPSPAPPPPPPGAALPGRCSTPPAGAGPMAAGAPSGSRVMLLAGGLRPSVWPAWEESMMGSGPGEICVRTRGHSGGAGAGVVDSRYSIYYNFFQWLLARSNEDLWHVALTPDPLYIDPHTPKNSGGAGAAVAGFKVYKEHLVQLWLLHGPMLMACGFTSRHASIPHASIPHEGAAVAGRGCRISGIPEE